MHRDSWREGSLYKKSNLIKSILIATFMASRARQKKREKERQREALMPHRIARLALLNIQVRASVKKLFMSSVLHSARFLPREARAKGEAGPR